MTLVFFAGKIMSSTRRQNNSTESDSFDCSRWLFPVDLMTKDRKTSNILSLYICKFYRDAILQKLKAFCMQWIMYEETKQSGYNFA